MNEALDKVVGFFLAAVLMFAIPFYYFEERREGMEQGYLLTETTEFVDTVRNTGSLEEEVYQRYLKKISAATGLYEINMQYTAKKIEFTDGRVHLLEEDSYETELLGKMESEGRILFQKGDFFRVELVKKTTSPGFLLLQWLVPELNGEEIAVYYGGCIRNDGG